MDLVIVLLLFVALAIAAACGAVDSGSVDR
jgi:hypothetical protein